MKIDRLKIYYSLTLLGVLLSGSALATGALGRVALPLILGCGASATVAAGLPLSLVERQRIAKEVKKKRADSAKKDLEGPQKWIDRMSKGSPSDRRVLFYTRFPAYDPRKKCLELTSFIRRGEVEVVRKALTRDMIDEVLVSAAKIGASREMIEMMICEGANPGYQTSLDGYGNTALMWAIANANHSSAIHLIDLAREESWNQRDSFNFGSTALILAVCKGYETRDSHGKELSYTSYQVVERLLQAGVDPNLSDNQGRTPLDFAKMRRDQKLTELLESYGATSTIEEKSYEEVRKLLKEQVGFFLLNRF